MTTSLSERIINTLCKVGDALSAAVGNSPEDVQARKDLGIPNADTKEEAAMGIKPEKEPPVRHRRCNYS